MLYTLYGLLCSVIGLLAGPLIDAIDLRTALLIGTIPSFLGRFGSAVTTSRSFVSMCSYALLPLGAAFSMPVFALGVRRFTHAENRAFAFTVFYAVLCVASMTGGLLITWVRANFHDGITLPLLGHLSWMRVNVLVTALFTLYTSIISCFVRKIRVRQDVPIETGDRGVPARQQLARAHPLHRLRLEAVLEAARPLADRRAGDARDVPPPGRDVPQVFHADAR